MEHRLFRSIPSVITWSGAIHRAIEALAKPPAEDVGSERHFFGNAHWTQHRICNTDLESTASEAPVPEEYMG
jgi:hypothetical protein